MTDELVTRAAYQHFTTIETRWMDNDVYGHINNVVYYSFFDTAVNKWLIDQGVLSVSDSPVIGLVVETQCRYFSSLTFPDRVVVGLRVAHVGSSSVRYDIALFRNGSNHAAAAGHFVHVYVNRATRKSVRIPDDVRNALGTLAQEIGALDRNVSRPHTTPPAE